MISPDNVFHVTASTHSWDNRYSKQAAPTHPSRILAQFAHCLPTTGRAIDLACGGGRNCVFLAHHGLYPVGVDRSRTALMQGRELARKNGATVGWVQADLEHFALPPLTFDAVVCTSYRDPKLYPLIRDILKPSGLLVYQTFSREQLQFGTGPANPDHLLERAELYNAFEDWKIIYYRETWIGRGIATLVARKPTVQNQGSAIIETAEAK